jgi:CHASE3 domain sensor protein
MPTPDEFARAEAERDRLLDALTRRADRAEAFARRVTWALVVAVIVLLLAGAGVVFDPGSVVGLLGVR